MLVLLSACQAAGAGNGRHSDDQGVLASLGPHLGGAGIPTVLAMQANISAQTVSRFLPVFFNELRQDGVTDRAMAVARHAVRDAPDWWAPVLFTRMKTGRIWYTPGFKDTRAEPDWSPPPSQPRVFLCHSSSDKPSILRLYHKLKDDGIQAWLDEEDLLGGQDWELEILKAIRASKVVLVCLSNESVNKVGYVQREIKYVLDVADEQPEGNNFLIPVRLEPCDVPERLRRWHWIDLFKEPRGHEKLLLSVRAGLPSKPP